MLFSLSCPSYVLQPFAAGEETEPATVANYMNTEAWFPTDEDKATSTFDPWTCKSPSHWKLVEDDVHSLGQSATCTQNPGDLIILPEQWGSLSQTAMNERLCGNTV